MLPRLSGRLLALLGLSVVWLLVMCGPALAHARLLETDPTEDATLAEPPEQVQLRFNEPIEAEFSPVKVFDSQGNRVDRDDARVEEDDHRVLTADLENLVGGSYTVDWRVTSADGHPVNGSYGFTVTSSSAGGGDSAQQTTQPSEPESATRQNAAGGSGHSLHAIALGIGALVILALALLRQR